MDRDHHPDRTAPNATDDNEHGATMVEYGLMMALIALVAFAAVTAFGMSVTDLFGNAHLLESLS